MASGTTRSASVLDRESVATRIRVGDWDVSRQKGMRCLKTFSVARHCALYEHASLPAAARWTSTGRSVVVVEPYNSAADPDASSARDEETSVQRPASYGPREAKSASTTDLLTPSRASLACRG
ncbi:hypothetical protein TcCL_Unassigned05145 [Trypanosoma cruzi]|nr:hypothetical protein TcCL_Unassigned05145 [Trypanosoma cruzi]